MKKTTIISVVLIIAAFLIGYGLGTQKQIQRTADIPQKNGEVETKEPIKIGVIASLTGTGAARGESARQGIDLALKKIEQNKEIKQPIKLLYQDVSTVGVGKEAITAFNQLVKVEKVVAIIGPMGSSSAISVAPLVDSAAIPIIMHTASAEKITQDNEYVFRIWPIAQDYADIIIDQIKKRGYKKIATLSSLSDNTIDLLNILKVKLDQLDPKVSMTIDEQAAPEIKDFRTNLTKIKQTDAEILFINLFEGQIGIAAKQAREMGLEIPLFTNAVMSAVEIPIGGAALEGIWWPNFTGYNEQSRQEFIDAYGKEPANPDSAAAAYDALMILSQAISKVGTDPIKIKEFLYNNSFNGSIGEFSFLDSGDAQMPLKIKSVKDGQIINLEKQ